jgi:beta-glucosidase
LKEIQVIAMSVEPLLSQISSAHFSSFLQDLALWHHGDDLILHTASQCANTIVVLHTVGAVSVEAWYNHPNVTAILYAGLPGQESGNSLLDVLIGTVNP